MESTERRLEGLNWIFRFSNLTLSSLFPMVLIQKRPGIGLSSFIECHLFRVFGFGSNPVFDSVIIQKVGESHGKTVELRLIKQVFKISGKIYPGLPMKVFYGISVKQT